MRLAAVVTTPEVSRAPAVALLSGSFEEKLARAAAIGYHGVELMTTGPAALDHGAVRRQLERAGLEAAAIASGALFAVEGLTLLHERPEVRREAGERARRLVDLAASLEAPVTIGSFRGRIASMGGGAAGREALAEALAGLADYAAPRGVRVALEPLNRYEADALNTAAETLEFIRAAGRANLGLLLDTFHANIEEAVIAEAVRLAAPRLWHVHLGDSNREPPGRGHFDFAGFVRALRRAGYDGYLSAELLARPDPDAAAELTWRHMAPLLHQ